MEYDEKYFSKSANRKAMSIWLLIAIVLTVAYILEVVKGSRTLPFLIVFLLFCWVPFALGLVLLKLKGWGTNSYKHVISVGYGIFYVFVMFTSDSPIVFTYILPLLSMLVLFKDRNYMLRCAVTSLLSLIAVIIYNISIRGMSTSVDIVNYEIQVAVIILCDIGYVLSINHLNKSDGAMLDSVKGNLQKVVTTIEQVKEASNAVVDGVTVVRELSEENKEGANAVVQSMEELSGNNNTLNEKIDSTMEITENIDSQVSNVSTLTTRIVEIIEETANHAHNSAKELGNVVDSKM